MTEQGTLRDRVMLAILMNHGTWSERRAKEWIETYHDNPKNLEPEIRAEVKLSYKDADSLIGVVVETCALIADRCHQDDENNNGAAATGAAQTAASEIRQIIAGGSQ